MSAESSFVPDLLFLLGQNGYGSYGVTLFVGSKAIYPATIVTPFRALITIIRTGGAGEEGTHNLSRDTIAYEQPSAQIVTRADEPDDAQQVSLELYDLLYFLDTRINGTWWRKCAPKQEPFDLPPDEKQRARFAFNIETTKRLSPLTS